jgi:STE24 endopeptidase
MTSASSPTKSRSSTNSVNSADPNATRKQVARLVARLAFFFVLVVATAAACAPRPACAATYVDRRVSALSAASLLAEPGSALVDPRRQRAARRFAASDRPLFFGWALAQIAAFFWLWASGRAARLREAVRRRIRQLFAMRFVYGALLAYVAGAASFPASLARYRIDLAFALTNESAFDWIRDGILTWTLDALVVGTIVACVFALVDRTRLWYLYAAGGLVVVTLAMAFLEPVLVAPLYNRFVPLSTRSPVFAPLERLAERGGAGGAPIFVSDRSRRTWSVGADIAGFGPTKRIVLGDALLANATTGEVLFLAAREFGHYAHGDDFRLSLFWTSLFIVCTALAVVTADRIPVRRDDDPLARLALVFGFMGLYGLAVTPIYNGYSRNLESRADAFALALTGDPASAVRVYVRIADETLAPLCPTRSNRLYFYNSPPLGTRIAKATGKPDPCR